MSRIALHRRVISRSRPIPVDRLESRASRILAVGLPALLGLMCVLQLASWLPHYLTWPWWADHDVFATLALGWDSELLPYRDLAANNFPGTIYLFWILGRLVGWGWSPAFYLMDSGMLLIFAATMLAWSARRFGSVLPGLVGYAAFSSYYLSLDYSVVAQRDWHGPFFAVTGLLLADAYPGRLGRFIAAVGLAIGFSIRPQVMLLAPAFAFALVDGLRRSGEPRKPARVLLAWGLVCAASVVVAFLPIIAAGIPGDFLRSLRPVMYGGVYNRVRPAMVLVRMVQQFASPASWTVPAAVALFAARAEDSPRRASWTWLAAFVAVAFHKPISPIAVPYLDTPLRLIWSINLALAVALVRDSRALVPTVRLAVILCVISLGVKMAPRFCDPERSIAAVKALARRGEPAERPLGYTHAYLRKPYPWADYRRVLAYVRARTSPRTRVANALKHDPALTGPTGRLPAFPAESLAWVRMVRPDHEARFVRALERATDSVVVWAPGEAENGQTPRIPALFAVIRRLYEPVARFGSLEVWRRKPSATLSRIGRSSEWRGVTKNPSPPRI